MKLEGYYSSGDFAKKAGITKKTIRYYHEHNILKPSYINENGARFYTDEDFARLQQILLFKYLGFSLDDIKEMTINTTSSHFLYDSLILQKKLVEDRIDQLSLVCRAIDDTAKAVQSGKEIDWSSMLKLINLTGMEKTMKNQYRNTSNISARINLHQKYSINKTGWFPWLFTQCDFKNEMNILEAGCGDGSLWINNLDRLPDNISITLSDISEGMIRDVRRSPLGKDSRFSFIVADCHDIPYEDKHFDMVIANHVLFYCNDIDKACSEISRVIKPGGRLICSTYGTEHMIEITKLVQEFDARIVLAADNLYNHFGKENGAAILSPHFSSTKWSQYEDGLLVSEADPLISYILSCHGNQNQYIIDRYNDFRTFIRKKISPEFAITKDAGIFIAYK